MCWSAARQKVWSADDMIVASTEKHYVMMINACD